MPEINLTEPQRKAAVNAIVNKHAAASAAASQKQADQEEGEAESDDRKLAALASLLPEVAAGGGGGGNETLNLVLAELLQSIKEDRRDRAEARAKKQAEQDEKIAEFNRLKAAQVENVKQLHAREKRTQEACPHTKENGQTRLAGQRMHNGDLVLLCSFCHKTFTNEEIPARLFPRGEAMGLDGTS